MSKFGKYLWKILILICLLEVGTLDMQAGKDKDVAYLREKVTEQLLDVPISDKQIRTIVETVRPDGTWPGIDYVDVSRTAFQHVRHLNNLVQLAIAYQQKGSPWKGNKSVKQAFDKGLAYWLAHDFQCENWWNNEIGTPTSFITMLLVMDKHLTKGQIDGMLPIARRANLNASGARPSGDRIKIAGLQAKTALFCWDAAQVSDVMQVIEGEIKIVEQPATGLVYLVCYRAVEQKLDQNRGVLRVDSPALLMARYHSNGRLKSLTVADPSRKLSHLHVSFSGKYETGNTSTQIRSSYDTALQETFLSIALPQGAYAGSSVSVSFDE